MTPALLRKIAGLVEAGATVVGPPPRKSPSLMDYPQCDEQVRSLATELWNHLEPPGGVVERPYGAGRVVWGGNLCVNQNEGPAPRAIDTARWIWFPEGNPAAAVATGTRYFRRVFTTPPEKEIRSARLEITADNDFQVWLNGNTVAQGTNFHVIYTADITERVKSDVNVLAVAAINGGDAPNPAGLIASVHVAYEDGSEQTIPTDRRWQATQALEQDWHFAAAVSGSWESAKELGAADMAPWRLDTAASDHFPDLYPDYRATARLLAEDGLPPDFESDGPIRYTHRRLENVDIYFVANREGDTVATSCTFRVSRKQPELWDPLTGAVRDLPEFTEQSGRIRVPLRFGSHQSFFVVFRRKLNGPPNKLEAARNFPELRPLARIGGPWNVSFDPGLGGPEQVTWSTLQDWSRQPDPAIKHYSGIANYRTTFDVPQSAQLGHRSIMLDLGVVHSMARVHLNGYDLGVVWCAPWSVDITRAVQANDNRLEIEIANLWPNRLIGDKSLPPDQQVSWTTFNPYKPDSPLLPSGLLGPITLRVATAAGMK
jgi:hypothetical protein